MIHECAWCRVILEFGKSETEQVTHTICGLCESLMQPEVLGKDSIAHMTA
jgi:hypothetical protein